MHPKTTTASYPMLRTETASNLPERIELLVPLYARIALGSAFLSAVGSRLGLWGGGLGRFADFVRYTAEVNSFMPPSTIPFLAVMATIAELSLGLALIVGFRLRWTALASALLLTLFATAMAISQGIKSPLDYSVFSAASGALLLAFYDRDKSREHDRVAASQVHPR